jgi:hypothetical protein
MQSIEKLAGIRTGATALSPFHAATGPPIAPPMICCLGVFAERAQSACDPLYRAQRYAASFGRRAVASTLPQRLANLTLRVIATQQFPFVGIAGH